MLFGVPDPAFAKQSGLPSRQQFELPDRAAQRPVGEANLAQLVRIEGQYSAKPLLSFEKYAVGNHTIGRGYDPATVFSSLLEATEREGDEAEWR